jgi:drug/metabolite transporter (DMT)-like permease
MPSFPDSHRLLGLLALALVIIGNAAGNVLLKLGADSQSTHGIVLDIPWQTFAGIACFGSGILFYAWALKQFDLHVAQIIVSVQYVVVIFLANRFLGEHISLSQWLGIALIAAGLFFCAR